MRLLPCSLTCHGPVIHFPNSTVNADLHGGLGIIVSCRVFNGICTVGEISMACSTCVLSRLRKQKESRKSNYPLTESPTQFTGLRNNGGNQLVLPRGPRIPREMLAS